MPKVKIVPFDEDVNEAQTAAVYTNRLLSNEGQIAALNIFDADEQANLMSYLQRLAGRLKEVPGVTL